jgi:adenylylsulfate kinase
MIVLMAGLPASGKSTLCRELAARTSGTILDKDRIRAALFSGADIEYSTEQDDFCQHIILETAAYLLRKNPAKFVFLDGRPFSRRYQIDEVLRTAESLHQPWRILQCVCSDETARQRLSQQAESGEHPAADRDYDLYLRVKAAFEEITLPKMIIDTDLPLEVCAQRALGFLQST